MFRPGSVVSFQVSRTASHGSARRRACSAAEPSVAVFFDPSEHSFVSRHFRIIGALLMREMTTRYGREGLGFLWVVGEPLLFCFGVIIMWTLVKPAYEHGIRLGPLVMTGYMSLLMYRHMISISLGAIQGNIGLMHHRQIGIMHIFLARNLMEFAGGTAAFAVVYVVLFAMGQVDLPANWLLLYAGWIMVGFTGLGVALIFAGLAIRFELMERLVPVLTYAMIPLSGAFFMLAWIPQQYRDLLLLVPFPNAIEMVRDGVFGEFVPTYYHADYALLSGAKNRVAIE
jgi:capsular polysaccharide transport system permease protein